MARPPQEAIQTFMSITGASEAVALQKLEEHGGDLNEAVNAHFNEGDRFNSHPTSVPVHDNDFMDIDEPINAEGPSLPLLSASRRLNPFELLDPNIGRSFFDSGGASGFTGRAPHVSYPRELRKIPIEFKDEINQSGSGGASGFTGRAPHVSHPRELRKIPIEFKDEINQSGSSSFGPSIEDVTESAPAHGPEVHGTVIIDEDDEDLPVTPAAHATDQNERKDDFYERQPRPSAPQLVNLTDYNNDIEEEMIQAAIEASKREAEGYPNQQFGIPDHSVSLQLDQKPPALEDVELAHAVSLSLKTAEREKSLHEQGLLIEQKDPNLSGVKVGEQRRMTAENERQGFVSSTSGTSHQFQSEEGSPSFLEDAEDIEEQPLVRHRSRRITSGATESANEVTTIVDSPPSSPGSHDVGIRPQHNEDVFPSDEWGGISSEEHDEAVMLEAAMFGGIPERSAYSFAYPSHQALQSDSDRQTGLYPRIPRSPSPTLAAQRLIREQQDDEYLAALQADREKELKAMQEAELRRLEQEAAREAALEEEKHQQEETRKKLLEEEEFERDIAAKQASLPPEPPSDDESAVTLLVRMPDGSRRGRRFLKSDKLQSLFDFIDVGRVVKPHSYRLVRPYPRRAFSDGETELSLSELGLTSKQEALFLELI